MRELIFGFIGGTALLMYGVDKMGDGLEKASGQMMKKILSVLTGNIFSAFLVGTFLTALVQSSTAITILTVGFVNAGLMELPQAVGIIYGANIGTTITAQIMQFSFNLNLTEIALPVLGIGFLISYFAHKPKLKNIGDAVMGFGMMFLGLKILNSGVPYLENSGAFKRFFENHGSISVVAVLLGAGATALVHSSSATVGLTMILGKANLINLRTAICIMLGDNVGTCVSAQLASLTGNINARRTAWAHTLYNIFGVTIVWICLPWFMKLVEWITATFQPTGGMTARIANSHTIFNLVSAIIFLPITKYYVRFLETVIKNRREDGDEPIYLDTLLLDTSVAAFKAALSEIIRGASIAQNMINDVMYSFYNNDDRKIDSANADESMINELQKAITKYVVDISKRNISDSQSVLVPAMINIINNIERIGDLSEDLLSLAKNKMEKGLKFSDEATNDLKNMQGIIAQMFETTLKVLKNNDIDAALVTAGLENKIDELCKNLQDAHIERLECGTCVIESGVIYLDVISYLERIADHIYKVCTLSAESLKDMPR